MTELNAAEKFQAVLVDLAANGKVVFDVDIVLGRTQWRTVDGTPPCFTVGDIRALVGPSIADDVWDRIGADPELRRARQKLSMHELRLIIRHAWAAPPKAMTDAERAAVVNAKWDEAMSKIPPPCQHEFSGWREIDGGRGGERFCKHCGLGAMEHSMEFLP